MLFFILYYFLLEDEIVCNMDNLSRSLILGGSAYAENIAYINAVLIYVVNLYGGYWVMPLTRGHGYTASEHRQANSTRSISVLATCHYILARLEARIMVKARVN